MKKRVWNLLTAMILVILWLSGCGIVAEQSTTVKMETHINETPSESVSSNDIQDETGSIPDTSLSEEQQDTQSPISSEAQEDIRVEYGQEYISKKEVAEYIYTYKELPPNYIRKNDAKQLGWVSKEGNLQDVAPGKSIGGDYFGNYEGQLPTADGRSYTECDINYHGGYRQEERIIFSNDGLIYYTNDHYNTFTLLYGEP